MKYNSILVCVLFLLFSCQKAPTTHDIIGNWNGADGAELLFKSDGTFRGKFLPTKYFSYSLQKDYGERFEGYGNWSFNEKMTEQIILDFDQTTFDSISEGSYYGLRIYAEPLNLFSKEWHLYLWEDPIEEVGDLYIFLKVKESVKN